MSVILKDTKYMKTVFQDKSMTLELSYCSNLILLDLAGTAGPQAGSGDPHLAENVCLKGQMKQPWLIHKEHL